MPKIKREKVNEAIEMLWQNKRDKQRRKNEVEEEKQLTQIHSQCKITHHKKHRRQHPISFSKQTILSEMKSHMIHRDWSKVKNLFLLLLHSSTEIEPLIWRYGLILTLYSNIDNIDNISQFFNMCIGSRDTDKDLLLKNFLLFSRHKQ
ncbi:uncharacterized protein LOC143184781 [Calliopsis andreniformis]|uniref:uncharacterized protein LOC143184781 n=1 Tax=Calliopsis andreniformis TaxID=337506 RepID=UPI003FCE6D01